MALAPTKPREPFFRSPERGRTQRTTAIRSTDVWNVERTHRYRLDRWFDTGRGVVHFCMLNPSAASAEANDATVAKCERYARLWGYNHLITTNAFAMVARYPIDLTRYPDPVGPDNDKHILAAAKEAYNSTIVAWGDHGAIQGRHEHLLALLGDQPLHALRVNASGMPSHPIYLTNALCPIPYEPRRDV